MWHVSGTGEVHTGFWWGISERNRPLGRPTRTSEDNIRVGLGEGGWGGTDCIALAEVRGRWRLLVNVVMNVPVP